MELNYLPQHMEMGKQKNLREGDGNGIRDCSLLEYESSLHNVKQEKCH